MSPLRLLSRPRTWSLACLLSSLAAQDAPLRFLHMSDTHLPRAESERFVRELLDRTDGAIAFSIHTGDITEFGGRRRAWPDYLTLFRGTQLPHYDALGNHDQTWDGLADRLREAYGAAHYRFDAGGVTFFCMNSASHQDPRPSFGEGQLRWLERELDGLPRDRSIVLFQHHAPDCDEFATPYEVHRVFELLAGRDVLAFFVGHGHAARSGPAGAWRWVMGGTTFGRNQGHGECVVDGRAVRYVYDYQDPERESVVLMDTEGGAFAPFSLALDAERRDGSIALRLAADGPAPEFVEVRAFVDFAERAAASVDDASEALVVPIDGLVPGVHAVSVVAATADGRRHHRLHEFEVAAAEERGRLRAVWSVRLPEALQGPMAVGYGLLVCAGNLGTVRAFDLATGAPRWQHELQSPAPGGVVADGAGGFVVGTLDGDLVRLDRDGEPGWRHEVPDALAAAPFVADGVVVACDLGGVGHAFEVQGGDARWQQELAGYAIEKPPVRLDDRRALVGAWDTRVHAFDLADGEPAWSLRSRGARAKAARYYSPADCPPAVVDGRAFVADRKFELTVIDLDGSELPKAMSDVASVAVDAEAHAVYLRRTTGAVTCVDARTLDVRWHRDLPVGRTPTPVSAGSGMVFAIGEHDGVLYALDAADGTIVDRRRVNVGHYPFCPVLVADGVVATGGMDGWLRVFRASGS